MAQDLPTNQHLEMEEEIAKISKINSKLDSTARYYRSLTDSQRELFDELLQKEAQRYMKKYRK